MRDRKVVMLARRLIHQTGAGHVKWTAAVEENEFLVSFPESSVSISQPEHDRYRFSIYNDMGTRVYSVEPLMEDMSTPVLWGDLRKLYELAQLSALNADEILDDLLVRLGGVS